MAQITPNPNDSPFIALTIGGSDIKSQQWVLGFSVLDKLGQDSFGASGHGSGRHGASPSPFPTQPVPSQFLIALLLDRRASTAV